jgi:hypothetical protein
MENKSGEPRAWQMHTVQEPLVGRHIEAGGRRQRQATHPFRLASARAARCANRTTDPAHLLLYLSCCTDAPCRRTGGARAAHCGIGVRVTLSMLCAHALGWHRRRRSTAASCWKSCTAWRCASASLHLVCLPCRASHETASSSRNVLVITAWQALITETSGMSLILIGM